MDLLGFEYSQRQKYGPAPKEERMRFENRCRKCDAGFMANVNNAKMCPICQTKRATELRAVGESLRVVPVGEGMRLGDIEDVPISEHTNTFTTAGADWRIYAAERRVDDNGHRYMMPVSDEWPPIPFSPDTLVQPVRLERWEDEG